jgi:hypothetical protein
MERIKKFPRKITFPPFRYVTSEIESDVGGEGEESSMPCSVMYKDDMLKRENLAKSFETALGVGNIEIIEQVMKKHEHQRRQEK